MIINHAIGLLERELNSFPTTLEHDLRLLETEIPLRRYFAILYRSQIKFIICEEIDMLRALL